MVTNDALVTSSALDSMIGGFRAHLLGRSLPAPAFVRLDMLDNEIEVYPQSELGLVSKLGNLLQWAHTLTDVTAEWWRSNLGNRLHVNVSGRSTGGLRMKVHQGGDFAECAGLVQLDPNQAEAVSLDEISALVRLLRERMGVA